jgi:hypothetical protein
MWVKKASKQMKFIGLMCRVLGVFLFAVVSAAAQQAPINCKGPLSEEQLTGLLKGGVADVRVQAIVKICGIGFPFTPDVERRLRAAGASGVVIAEVRRQDETKQRREEERLWAEAKDGRSAERLQEYLKRFPDGQHASEAREKLTQLKRAEELRTNIRQAKKESRWQESESWLQELSGLLPEDEEMRSWKSWVTGERARWDSMTPAEAKQEIASLEEKITQAHKTVEVARDEELKEFESIYRSEREKAGQVAPKGEYERSVEYEARLADAKQKQTAQDLKWQAEKAEVENRYAAEFEQKISPYNDRIVKLKDRTYLMPGVSVQRIGYDADASHLSVRINGEEYWFKMEPQTAREFDPRLGSAKVEQYLDTDRTHERVLVDTATAARFNGISRIGEELARMTWTDPQTGLMWSLKDNGSDVDWSEAASYCRALKLGPFSDWRLPEIGELEGIYDASSEKQYKAKGGIQLSNWWAWSATKEGSGSAWDFHFSVGKRYSTLLVFRFLNRALCVRRSGE